MALDPNILLQTTSFNEQFQKQQAALASAQAQQNQLQLQNYSVAQAKQQFEDTQNFKTAWHQANGDPAETIRIASQLGVSPAMIQKYQSQQLATQQEMANLDKTRTETGKTILDVQMAKRTALGNLFAPVASGDPSDIATYSKNLQNAISTGVNQGLLSKDEAAQYAQMSPADLQVAYKQNIGWTANAKAVKDMSDANKANVDASLSQQKQNNESGGQQADSILKQRGSVSPQLEGALKSGNPLAYGQTLAKLDPTSQLGFPSQDDVAKMSPAQAISMVRSLATSSEDKIKNEQAQAQLDNTKNYQTQELAVRKQEANASQTMAQANLALRQQGLDDREVSQLSAPFVKIATNAQTQLGNIDQAITQLNTKSGATQFMGLLSALKADVAGGGVRLNNSEYQHILQSRLGGQYASTMQKLTTGTELSQSQVDALKGAMTDLKSVVTGKINDAANAMQDISASPNQAVRQGKVQWYLRNKFGAGDEQTNGGGQGTGLKVGDIKYRNGQKVRIDAINPDGSVSFSGV